MTDTPETPVDVDTLARHLGADASLVGVVVVVDFRGVLPTRNLWACDSEEDLEAVLAVLDGKVDPDAPVVDRVALEEAVEARPRTLAERVYLDPFDDAPDVRDLTGQITGRDAGEIPDSRIVRDLLLLTGQADHVTIDEIDSWANEDVEEVVAWAAAVHLNASDHDDVVVPDRPAILDPSPALDDRATGDPGAVIS